MGQRVSKKKKLISFPLCFFVLFNDRAANGRKQYAKLREVEILKNLYIFAMCTFPKVRKQNLETRCIKQHAFLVDPLRDSCGFSNADTLIVF